MEHLSSDMVQQQNQQTEWRTGKVQELASQVEKSLILFHKMCRMLILQHGPLLNIDVTVFGKHCAPEGQIGIVL